MFLPASDLLFTMLSFVVPAYNEEVELPATISAIRQAADQAKQDYEVIVVDDGSADGTAQIALAARAKVVSISRRQIAAARNAGARVAQGDVLFFVDADTRINYHHIHDALEALQRGRAGGGARVAFDGNIPGWARLFAALFCPLYFGVNLGAGAFLFTTRENFIRSGGFDEDLFVGEEVFFSLALRKIGWFEILHEPVVTSGRKLRMYSGREIFGNMVRMLFLGMRAARSRHKLDIWYNGRRETKGV